MGSSGEKRFRGLGKAPTKRAEQFGPDVIEAYGAA